jgi:hypothetical protein
LAEGPQRAGKGTGGRDTGRKEGEVEAQMYKQPNREVVVFMFLAYTAVIALLFASLQIKADADGARSYNYR